MNRFMGMIVAVGAMNLAAVCGASVIGPGTGFGENTGNQDDSTGGGIRTIVDSGNGATLGAGAYSIGNVTIDASQLGDVQPFLAVLSSGTLGQSNEKFTVIAAGTDTQINSTGIDTFSFGGTNTLVVPSGGETVYAGFTDIGVNPKVSNGQYQPIAWAAGGSDEHANPGFGAVATSEAIGHGTTTGDFGYPGLGRTYAIGIDVSPVPEPASLSLVGLAAVGLLARRRR